MTHYLILTEWFVATSLLTTCLLVALCNKVAQYTNNHKLIFWLNIGKKPMLALVGISCILAALISLETNWVFVMHGIFGQLSITSLVLLAYVFSVVILHKPLCSKNQMNWLLIWIIVVGSLFYLFALGAGYLNPYNLGFGSYVLLFNLIVVLAFCYFKKFWLGFYIILLAMIAQMLNLHESTNLWDYLIDGCAWLASCFIIFSRIIKTTIKTTIKVINKITAKTTT